jgi:hypothetical protein
MVTCRAGVHTAAIKLGNEKFVGDYAGVMFLCVGNSEDCEGGGGVMEASESGAGA